MAFTFAAFAYIVALIIDAFLIFFAIFHVNNNPVIIVFVILMNFGQIIAFDELKTDYKNPIDQCASLNPLVLPEYILHIFFNVLFLIAGEWFSLVLNAPLIGYHVHRYVPNICAFSIVLISKNQVHEPSCDVWGRVVRPNLHHERGHPEQVPEGGLDQAGILSPELLLLFIWVRDGCNQSRFGGFKTECML